MKETTINKLNKTREDADIQVGHIYLKDERGGKNNSIFRKVIVSELDNNIIEISEYRSW